MPATNPNNSNQIHATGNLPPTETQVYVVDVDPDIYSGRLLRPWDRFTSTRKASKYIGCRTDEVAAEFRRSYEAGYGWGVAKIKGALFFAAHLLERPPHNRPPTVDPDPEMAPRVKRRSHKARALHAETLLMQSRRLRDTMSPKQYWASVKSVQLRPQFLKSLVDYVLRDAETF
jgi:hypothetical protein